MDLFSIAGKIILDDGGVTSKLSSVDSKAKATGNTFDETFGRIKGAALKLGGALLGGMGLKEVFTEANESQSALTQMNTVLQSTHDASGMTKQGLEELAESTSRVTEYSKAQTEQGENLMLTFTRIGKEVFPGAMEASENMATAMHMDLNSAVLQVGKALGNLSLNSKGGIQGLTMLQREGVNFSEAEKKQIATMLQHNDVAGAQNVVLQELQTEFGNSAKAAGTTFPGQLKILKDSLLEVGSGILGKVIPSIQKAVSMVNDHMPQIQSTVTGVINRVTPVIQGLFSTIQSHMPQIQQLVSSTVSTVTGVIQTISPYLLPVITDIVTIAGNLLPKLSSSAKETGSAFSGAFKSALDGIKTVLDWMASHGEAVKGAIIGIVGALTAWKVITITATAAQEIHNALVVAGAIANGTLAAGQTALTAAKGGTTLATLALNAATVGHTASLAAHAVAMGVSSAASGVMTAAQWALNAALDANPIGIVILAIAALVTGLILLYNKNKTFRDFVNGMWAGIKSGVLTAINAIKAIFTALPAFFSGVFNHIKAFFTGIPAFFIGLGNKIKATATNIWNAITGFFTQTIPAFINSIGQWFAKLPYNIGYALGTVFKACINFSISVKNWITTELPQIIDNIVNWFAQLPGRIWTFLVQVVTNIGTWGSNMFNLAKTWVINTINSIGTWFSQLPGRIWTWLLNTVAKIGAWGSNMYSAAVSAVTNTINAIGTWFSQLPGRIWNFLTTIIKNIANWGSSMYNSASSAVRNVVTGIVKWFSDLPQNMLNIGKNIITGLWNGISGAAGWLWDKITGFCGNIVKGFKDALGIHSPSRVFADEVGKFMALGIGQGFTDNMQSVSDKMTDAVGAATSGLNIGVKAQVKSSFAENSVPTIAETVKAAVKGGDVNLNMNFYEKTPSPSENARQVKNVVRKLGLGFNLG